MSKAKYKNWSEFASSDEPFLGVVPKLEAIEKGAMHFSFECEGKKYHASGSHDYIGSYCFDPKGSIGVESNFDNFWLRQVSDSFGTIEEICN